MKLLPTWRLAELGEAVQIENSGVMPEAGEVYRYVGLEHIEQGTGTIIAAPETDGAEIRSLKYRFEPSHILYGKLRPNLNKVALPDFDGVCSTDLLPLAVRTPAVREYVAFYLRSPAFVHLATTRASGTKMPRFGPTLFLDAPVPLPPVLVQRRIVEILTKADEIRKKRAEATAVADAVLLSTFQHHFGDPLDNPSGYPLVPLGEIGEVVSGVTKGRPIDPTEAIEVPYLRVANVQDGVLDLSEIKTILALPEEVERLRLQEGDVLITEAAPPGRCAVWRSQILDCIHQNHVFRVRIDRDRATPGFVGALMQTEYAKHHFSRHARGTTMALINSAQLRNFRVPLPPVEAQRRFVEAQEQHLAVLSKIEENARVKSLLLSALQSQGFSGELTAEWERENADEIATHQRVHEELPRLVLVGLVNAAQREAARRTVLLTALMKYAFVFQMRNRTRQRLYAFRPYKYGPFASEIYDHLGVLEADGLLRQRESSGSSEREWRAIELTAKGRAYAEKLLPPFDPDLVTELQEVAREYGPLDHEALLDRVYAEYPAFARRSVRARSPAPAEQGPRRRSRR